MLCEGKSWLKTDYQEQSIPVTIVSYANAVKYAIKAACKAGLDVPHWMPYQMRYTAATKVRKYMGYESAGAVLGHTNMGATAIYAERNQGLANEAALKFG